jgi:hypothetical protein
MTSQDWSSWDELRELEPGSRSPQVGWYSKEAPVDAVMNYSPIQSGPLLIDAYLNLFQVCSFPFAFQHLTKPPLSLDLGIMINLIPLLRIIYKFDSKVSPSYLPSLTPPSLASLSPQ